MFSKLGPGLYICIGGTESSEVAFMINVHDKKITLLPNCPIGLAYGHLNKYKDKIFAIGALTIDNIHNDQPAPPICYDLKGKK